MRSVVGTAEVRHPVTFPEDFHHQYPEVYRRMRSGLRRTEGVLRYLRARGLLTAVRSVLSIGPGEGELEIELARDLDRLGVIDPDGRALEILRVRLRECGLEERLGVCLPERFQGDAVGAISERFDLVLSIHSWYAIARDAAALRHALGLRNDGGRLLISLASEQDMANELKALGPRRETDPTAEAVSEWADEAGFPHSFERTHAPRSADLFVDERGLTEVGRSMVGFLVSTPWDGLAEPVREEALRIVRAHVRSGRIESKTGWLLFERASASD